VIDLVSAHHQLERYAWRLTFVERDFEVVLGRTAEADLRLPAVLLSRRHARLHERDGRCWLIDDSSTSGTFVAGERVSRHELTSGDIFAIGELTLTFERVEAAPFVPADDAEAALVAAIASGDRASLLVYADYLEQRVDDARAAYARALHDLRGWDFAQRAGLGALAVRVAAAWRLALSP
jgi:predicted component of type VI protein secretion system